MASRSGQQPAHSTPFSLPNGQPSPMQQTPPQITTAGSSKHLANKGRSKKSATYWNLFTNFIVSYKHIGLFSPIIASVITLVFFYYFDGLLQPLANLYWPKADAGFLILISGLLCTFVFVLVYALGSMPFVASTNRGLRDYDLLEINEKKLRARLGNPEIQNGLPIICEDDIFERIGVPNLKQDSYKLTSFREASNTYLALYDWLYFPKGRQLLSNIGDLYAWEMTHRIEETLIDFEEIPLVIHDSLFNYSAIRNSPIDDRDELLVKLTRAIKDLNPKAAEFLSGFQSDKGFENLQEDIQKLHKALENKDTISITSTSPNQEEQTPGQNKPESNKPISESFARTAIRSVQEELHNFQDDRLAGILRARNNLILSIIAGGLITYAILFLSIITITDPNSFIKPFSSAVTLYVIGVAAGLFGRLYSEANQESAVNDYGLSQARLKAIPLLSGLSAIGGVFVVAATLTPTNGSVDLTNIFNLNIHNILVALIFGFAPNLLIRNLQQGADQYVSDLESTRK